MNIGLEPTLRPAPPQILHQSIHPPRCNRSIDIKRTIYELHGSNEERKNINSLISLWLRPSLSRIPHLIKDSHALVAALAKIRLPPGCVFWKFDIREFFMSGSHKDGAPEGGVTGLASSNCDGDCAHNAGELGPESAICLAHTMAGLPRMVA